MTTVEKLSNSLLAAMTKAGIPAENHRFIREVMSAVGIAEYHAVTGSDKPYVEARRRDGRPDLHIYYGYTNGFTSEEDIERVAGSGAVHAPSSRNGTWFVAHPTNQVRSGVERARSVRREAGVCSCGMQLSLTGACASCD